MGSYLTVVQGVYFKKNSKSIEVKDIVHCCCNEECSRKTVDCRDKFCRECGEPICKKEFFSTQNLTSLHQLHIEDSQFSDILDMVFEPANCNESLVVPNFSIPEVPDINLVDDSENNFVLINYEEIPKDILSQAKSNPDVQTVLKFFETYVGKDFLTVHYGLYSYVD